jgi:hypothetical protein
MGFSFIKRVNKTKSNRSIKSILKIKKYRISNEDWDNYEIRNFFHKPSFHTIDSSKKRWFFIYFQRQYNTALSQNSTAPSETSTPFVKHFQGRLNTFETKPYNTFTDLCFSFLKQNHLCFLSNTSFRGGRLYEKQSFNTR